MADRPQSDAEIAGTVIIEVPPISGVPWPSGLRAWWVKRRCHHPYWVVGIRGRVQGQYVRAGAGGGEVYTCRTCGTEKVGALFIDKPPGMQRAS